jgi:cell division protein FtsA
LLERQQKVNEILAEEILGLSVSRAKPAGLTGLYEHVSTPEFSTAVGLIKYLARSTEYEVNNPQTKWIVNSDEKKGIARKIWRWMENNL